MQKLFVVFTLALFGMWIQPLCGQEPAQKQTTTESKSEDDQPKKNMELAIEMTETIMSKMFQKADLDEEQTNKIDQILKENVKALVMTRQQVQDFLSAGERKTYTAALKMARKAKYDEKKAETYAMKKLKFSEAKLNEYHALKDKVEMINNKITDSIKALLTDEQIEKLPIFNTDMTKANKRNASGSGARGSATKSGGAKPAGGSEKK